MTAIILHRRWKLSAIVAVALLATLVGGCVTLEVQERELVFRPVREAAGWYSGIPASVREFYLPVVEAPGAPRIRAWYWPSDDASAPVIFYLHGARWNLTGHLNRIERLRSFGFSVFAIDYRGFGVDDGDPPSERTVYEDARVGWQWLVRTQPDPARRFIYGHSLGGAVAIDLAAELPADAGAGGLIVESSFTSLADIASELTHGWLPVGLLLTQKFDSVDKIGRVRMPVLIVHGGGDRYVPARFSEALFAAARPPKKLLVIENGSHNNSLWVGDTEYRSAVRELFGALDAPAAGGPSGRGAERDPAAHPDEPPRRPSARGSAQDPAGPRSGAAVHGFLPPRGTVSVNRSPIAGVLVEERPKSATLVVRESGRGSFRPRSIHWKSAACPSRHELGTDFNVIPCVA